MRGIEGKEKMKEMKEMKLISLNVIKVKGFMKKVGGGRREDCLGGSGVEEGKQSFAGDRGVLKRRST
jgi:hypothetical protein